MSQPRGDLFTKAVESVQEAASSSGGVSLEVLCRRAERLIDSVRMMGEQVNRMFAHPDQAVAQANDTARSLTELAGSIETKLAEARQAEQSCDARLDVFRRVLPSIEESAEGLVQRVARARELSEAFAGMIDSAADRIADIEAASAEAKTAREAVEAATQELLRVQKSADRWSDSVRQMSDKYSEFIASGNAAAQRLRTLTDAGERLRESVRQDIVNLRELLRESRLERLAWEQLLARMPDQSSITASKSGRSVPAALADRVRRLSDFIRQATEPTPSQPGPGASRLADASETVPGVARRP